jgi:hypothetical protein
MADISHLGNLNPIETLDLGENYAENKRKTFQLPAKGRYTVQAPDSFPPEAFGRTKKNALYVDISPTIVGPTNEGFQLKRQRVYASTWKRDGKLVSGIGDYLIANGVRGVVLSDEQQLADAVEATAGRVYEVDLDWVANNYSTGFETKGMDSFPLLADGTRQSWVPDPTAKDENGNPVKVRAFLEIVRFHPAA